MCLLYDGSTRRLTESGFMWFYGFMEKPGIEPATPGLQGIALIHYTTGASLDYMLCGFMEKPGIEPATPGLQGIALIHYTTGASLDCMFILIIRHVHIERYNIVLL